MALNDDEQREARQRAADRVSAYLDRREKIDALDRPAGATGSLVIDSSLGSVTLLAADLRLLVQAAPPLPPKWSGILADPTLHVVVQVTHRRTSAVERLRMLVEWARTDPDGNSVIFQMDGVQLRRSDLETLLAEDGEILLVTRDEHKAAAVAREHGHASVTTVTVSR
jgi:hypothetical protein